MDVSQFHTGTNRFHPTDQIDPNACSSFGLIELYGYDINHGMHFWNVYFDGRYIITTWGTVGGKPTSSRKEVKTNKSGRTLNEQAWLEMKSGYLEKYREGGYRPAGDTTPIYYKPQLAEVYKPGMIKHWPVYGEPKLDGVRCLATMPFNQVELRSRTNNPFTTTPHIAMQMELVFSYLPTNTTADGELYIHGMTFNELSGIIRADVNISSMIYSMEYHLFNVITPDNPSYQFSYEMLSSAVQQAREEWYTSSSYEKYAARLSLYGGDISKLMASCCSSEADTYSPHEGAFKEGTWKIQVIECVTINDENTMMDYMNYCVERGYEGAMVRKIHVPSMNAKDVEMTRYKAGRSTRMLKIKPWEDEEVIITGVYEGEGNEAGLACLICTDSTNREVRARPAFSFEERRMWLETPSLIVGRQMTLKYQGRSEYGVVRFPILEMSRRTNE